MNDSTACLHGVWMCLWLWQAAVWLRYGECLNSLGELTAAVEAYATVVSLAPSHSGARVTLSTLQQQLGRHEEALETLEHGETDQRLDR